MAIFFLKRSGEQKLLQLTVDYGKMYQKCQVHKLAKIEYLAITECRLYQCTVEGPPSKKKTLF